MTVTIAVKNRIWQWWCALLISIVHIVTEPMYAERDSSKVNASGDERQPVRKDTCGGRTVRVVVISCVTLIWSFWLQSIPFIIAGLSIAISGRNILPPSTTGTERKAIWLPAWQRIMTLLCPLPLCLYWFYKALVCGAVCVCVCVR